MPDIVAKITAEDGTEQAFGPVEIPQSLADSLTQHLEPKEKERLDTAAEKRTQELVAEQEKRSKEAVEHQKAREEAAAKGEDPDAVGVVEPEGGDA